MKTDDLTNIENTRWVQLGSAIQRVLDGLHKTQKTEGDMGSRADAAPSANTEQAERCAT